MFRNETETIRTAELSRRLVGITAMGFASILAVGPAAGAAEAAGPSGGAAEHSTPDTGDQYELFYVDRRDGKSGVRALRSGGGQWRRMAEDDRLFLSVSTDSSRQHVAIASRGQSGSSPETWKIEMMKGDGTGRRTLVEVDASQGYVGDPSLHPFGRRIAFTSGESSGTRQIMTSDTKGKGLTGLTGPADGRNFQPAWSPDGSKLAFVSDRLGEHKVFVMDPDGHNVRQVTRGIGDEFNPAWSPDGQRIIYDHHDPDHPESVVASVHAFSGDTTVRVLAADWPLTNPTWCPDGRTVVATHRDGRGVFLTKVDAMTGKTIGGVTGGVNLSPDCGYPMAPPDEIER